MSGLFNLAGGKMVMTHEGATTTINFDHKGTGRECGGCTLCCKLLPIVNLRKPSSQRCVHQTRKGCSIYASKPTECALWSCRWLIDVSTGALRRPDRTHYVIDMTTDNITVSPKDGSPAYPLSCIEVWCDPAFPDAHEDPALRAWINDQKMPAIVRYHAGAAFVLFPPCITGDGWERVESSLLPKTDDPVKEAVRALEIAAGRPE